MIGVFYENKNVKNKYDKYNDYKYLGYYYLLRYFISDLFFSGCILIKGNCNVFGIIVILGYVWWW